MCSKLAVLVVLAVCQCGLAWIFNNIDYRMLEKNFLEEMEASEEDYDLTPEELARLRFSLIYPGSLFNLHVGTNVYYDLIDFHKLGLGAFIDLKTYVFKKIHSRKFICRFIDNC